MMKITKKAQLSRKQAQLSKKTKRLEIRPLESRDFEVWCDAKSEMREPQNEWDETNWDSKYLTRKKFKEILANEKKSRDADKAYILGVFRKDDGRLIGSIGLFDISREIFQNAYLGYRIYNSYWGYGYGSEAVRAALQLGFRNLKLHRIEAGIEPHNKASIALAKSVGLSKEGLSPKRLCPRGKWVDLVLYAATCEDFKIKYKFPKK